MRRLRAAFLSSTALIAGLSAQSALAADLPLKAPPPALASSWAGLYVSLSAGGTWTRGDTSFSDPRLQSSSHNNFVGGVLTGSSTATTTSNAIDNQNGREAGAVFTFGMGYNIVQGSWLAGVQSEVSWNESNILVRGPFFGVSNSVETTPLPPGPSTTTTALATGINLANLQNRWTVSEMVRLGYLVQPDLLLYGLVGWSVGGFDYSRGSTPFTLNGITYGAGIEKDFGWLRAFVQYKGISYGGRSVDQQFSGSQQSTIFGVPITTIFNSSVAEAATRRFSADVHQVTAGITVPIDFSRSNANAFAAMTAPSPAAPLGSSWAGAYVSLSAGGSWTRSRDSLSDPSFSSNTSSQTVGGVLTSAGFDNTASSRFTDHSGSDAGAVFTFGMGYNVVRGPWVAGVQSEVSLNRTNIFVRGNSLTTSLETQATTFPPAIPTINSQAFTQPVTTNLQSNWTISEMLRLGYLVRPDVQVYGLVGWSLGGFDFDQERTPFTLNGITYGAGVEKDYGWLRAFVQYKGISYSSKSVDVSQPNSGQTTGVQATTVGIETTSLATGATHRFSADVHQVTAGITVPFNPTRGTAYAAMNPASVAPPKPWEGLYASFSTGETWTRARSTTTAAALETGADNSFTSGVLTGADTFAASSNGVTNQTGSGAGTVFTFGMGYNVVMGSWLAGVQSEASLNRSNILLQSSSQQNGVSLVLTSLPPAPPQTSTSIQSSAIIDNLESKWTISEMLRIGFLAKPDVLVYGLVGWSFGGFDLTHNSGEGGTLVTPFTLNGITYGAGVEKDFGWLRAFVQYKGISYHGKTIETSGPSFGVATTQQGTAVSGGNNVTTSTAPQRLSADVHQVTAGITVPFDFSRPTSFNAYAAFKAPPRAAPANRWEGPFASFSAGESWSSGRESRIDATASSFADNFFTSGVLQQSIVGSETTTRVDGQSGHNHGAVFTFGTGYNLVWGNWLAGVQSETSLNRTNILLQGISQSAQTQTQGQIFPPGGIPIPQTSLGASVARGSLENKWTVSEMLRLGYLVKPDLLLYGLVGWSEGGFEYNFDGGRIPFTLNGITYGAGIEQDFRWVRVFAQYKGISYSGKTIDVSQPQSFVSTNAQPPNSGVNTANTADVQSRRFSANVHQITAGVTIPIDLSRW